MENNKWADANALANVATGLGIYSLIPFFFGFVDNAVGCIPWMTGGMFFLILAVVGCFKNNDVVGATANGVLSGICLFGNLYLALITLISGTKGIPENIMKSLTMGAGTGYLGASVFCASVAWIAWKNNKLQAMAVVFPTIAFFLLFLLQTGITGPYGYVPMICFTIFGTWQLYSGIAIMYHQATGKQILPYIL